MCVRLRMSHSPRKFLFNFVLAEFFHHLHVLAKEHNVNGASYAKDIRLIWPWTTFEHFGTRESVGLDNLRSKMRQITWIIAEGQWKWDSHFSELCVRFEEIHVDSTSEINQSKRWYVWIRIWSESETIASCSEMVKDAGHASCDTYIFMRRKLSGLMSPWMILQECKWWTMFKIWLVKCMTRLSCMTCEKKNENVKMDICRRPFSCVWVSRTMCVVYSLWLWLGVYDC